MRRKRSQIKIGGAAAADPGLVKNTWEWERNKKWGGSAMPKSTEELAAKTTTNKAPLKSPDRSDAELR